MWVKGQSGNKKGRPVGTIAHMDLKRKLEKNAPAILDTLITLALSGDLQAIKICIDRLIPVLKQTELKLQIDERKQLPCSIDEFIQ